MGNRAYLDIDDVNVFESNNSLPGFWLGLVDLPALREYGSELSAFDDAKKDDEEFSPSLVIPRDRGLSNLRTAQQTIDRIVPDSSLLLEDFVAFLSEKEGSEFRLHLLKIAAFSSLEDFLALVEQDVAILQQQSVDETLYCTDSHDQIGDGCGFVSVGGDGSFRSFSPRYDEAMNSRRARPRVASEPALFSWKALLFYLVILVLCPLFTWLGWLGLQEDGWSIGSVSIFGTNLLFYWFSIYGVCGELKALVRGRKPGAPPPKP